MHRLTILFSMSVYSYLQSTSNLFSVSFDHIAILQIQIFRGVIWRHTSPINQESQRFHRLTLSLTESLHQSLHGRGFLDFEENFRSSITDLQVDVCVIWLFFLWLFRHWMGYGVDKFVLPFAPVGCVPARASDSLRRRFGCPSNSSSSKSFQCFQ